MCNNCGKNGHQFHQCKFPIISYGIILFRIVDNNIQYLMIRRKDSFGYIDFLRGKYNINNTTHLKSMFNEMSIIEKQHILNNNFETLWKMLWSINDTTKIATQYKYEEINSNKKFNILKHGYSNNNGNNGNNEKKDEISLNYLVENSTTSWKETEWEFPKGRKNYNEKELECALREFEEETGISKTEIQIIENMLPIEEYFVGSNHKPYKHKYFLGYTKYNNNLLNYQPEEVSKIEWKTLEECIASIRPYNLEKIKVIINIDKVLKEYSLYNI